eukprot:6007025-Amphidinium_carterae.2
MPKTRNSTEETKNKSTKQSGLADTLLLVNTLLLQQSLEDNCREQFSDYQRSCRSTKLYDSRSIEGGYDNSRKNTDKDKQPIPPRLYDLKSPAVTGSPLHKIKNNYYSRLEFQATRSTNTGCTTK